MLVRFEKFPDGYWAISYCNDLWTKYVFDYDTIEHIKTRLIVLNSAELIIRQCNELNKCSLCIKFGEPEDEMLFLLMTNDGIEC